jgi:uncharacterized protein (DUF2236 family)
MTLIRPFRLLGSVLAWPIRRRLSQLLYPAGTQAADFLLPAGEPALMEAASVSWRVFRNPVALLVGGMAAVLMELAEPRVRTGVWQHTTFREHPIERLQRTGYAAMMTVYGARSRTAAMIARINRAHERIAGHTPTGTPYRASDADLLAWVSATASFGFLQAYCSCVHPLSPSERDSFYAEGREAARLYGVRAPPASERDVDKLFEDMGPRLESSDIVMEFLRIMRRMPLLPWPLRPLQAILVKASVECLPAWLRERLGLDSPAWRLADWQWPLVRAAGGLADRLSFPALPALLAQRRLSG